MNVLDAASHTVHDYPGGAASLAPRLGMAQAVLNSKVNPNTSTHHLRLDESVKLMSITGDYRIHHAIAHAIGHVSIPMPKAMEHQDEVQVSLFDRILDLGKTKGQVCSELMTALGDSRICLNDVKQIKAAIYEMQCDLVEIVAAVESCLSEVEKGNQQ